MSWTDAEIDKLKRLNSTGQYFWTEIAEKLNKKPGAVAHMARKLRLEKHPNVIARMGEWNSKHSHLRESVFKYFLTHSFKETRERFQLTESELKSLFTVGYRDPRLTYLRKETRLHSSWSDGDWIFMVKHSGLLPRDQIAIKLNRGATYNSVKDALAKFRGLGKYMNGMPISWLEGILTDNLPTSIKTKAGPVGNNRSDFRYRIIPWIEMEKLIRGKKLDVQIKTSIKAMARFQRWIHGGKSDVYILRFIRKVCKPKKESLYEK